MPGTRRIIRFEYLQISEDDVLSSAQHRFFGNIKLFEVGYL